jgi:ferrous iron transport protein B
MFLRKMGGIILVGSIIIWILSAFPANVDYSQDYTTRIANTAAAYDQQLADTSLPEKTDLKKKRGLAIAALERAKKAEKVENSYMGKIGKLLAPVFEPIGIDWRGGVALLTGFVAKEIVVSTLGVLYATGDSHESDALSTVLQSSGMTRMGALSMMVFVLLYIPCLATVATIRKETGSSKWMVFSICYSTGTAWALSFLVYHGGRLMGFS